MAKCLIQFYLSVMVFEEYLRFTPKGWLHTFEEALTSGKPEPYGRNTQKIYEYMTFPLNTLATMVEKGELSKNEKQRRTTIREQLHIAVRNTNEEMMGRISVTERYRRKSYRSGSSNYSICTLFSRIV